MKNDIVLKIKDLMRQKGFTQEDLASKIGVTKMTISNYLSNRTKIDVDTLLKISEALDVSINSFFSETDEVSLYIALEIIKKILQSKASLIGFVHHLIFDEKQDAQKLLKTISKSIDDFDGLRQSELDFLLKNGVIKKEELNLIKDIITHRKYM